MATEIRLDEQFPHLSRAPIIEAAMEIRGRAQAPFEKDELTRQLGNRLSDYPQITVEHGLESKIDTRPNSGGELKVTSNVGILWQGLQCRSISSPHVARFTRDFFSFSRLHPYENFEAFSAEGIRLLQIHQSLADIATIQRLGLRFINRIEIPANGRLKDYLTAAPREMSGLRLPFAGFFHNDTIVLPGHPIAANVIRTMQVYPDSQNQPPALILDIGVYTTEPLNFSIESIAQHLQCLRWLKNKLFFGNVTKAVIESFQ